MVSGFNKQKLPLFLALFQNKMCKFEFFRDMYKTGTVTNLRGS